jgi:hypothetical protein
MLRLVALVFLRRVLWLVLTANIVPSSPILVTVMMEAIHPSETSVLARATRRNFLEDFILLSPLSYSTSFSSHDLAHRGCCIQLAARSMTSATGKTSHNRLISRHMVATAVLFQGKKERLMIGLLCVSCFRQIVSKVILIIRL